MKICYFFSSHSYEGFQSFNVHMMEFLNSARKIPDIEVVEGFPLVKTNKELDPELKVFHKVKHNLPRFSKDLLGISYNFLCFCRAIKVMKKEKPDVVLLRNIQFTFYNALIRFFFKVPVVLEVNTPNTYERKNFDQIFFKRISFLIEKFSWIAANKIYTVSDYQKQMMIKWGVPSNKIFPIHNGANLDLYKDLDYSQKGINGEVRCVFVGSFQKFHGLENIIDAFAGLHDKYPNLKVDIIGYGELFDKVKKNIEDNNQSDFLNIVGFVKYEDIPKYTVKADITFLPNFTIYGSPLKLFEYMAAKTAIIVPNRECIAEVVEDGKEALAFEALNMDDFREKMERLITDEKLRKSLAENAYNKVVNNYTWDHNAQRVVEVCKIAYKEYHKK